MKYFAVKVVAAAVVFYALFLAFMYERGALSEAKLMPPEKNPPGWTQLRQCADLTSFDGATTMTLDDDGNATMSSEGKGGREAKGQWTLLDDAKHTYGIGFGDRPITYLWIMPPGAEGCMLVPGEDAKAADLEGAWFSTPDPDDE